ncbi:hypothetical protein IHE45_19G095500 [Dioscorea alata]|uniref:Uncharacterized protein n=2 Tax=Dioscorea alata TaxID=55571 RepID=A0ACB7U016_DIOAL|nr:hypothetical protein IHE45_19G095500 [Dioscorea alata]KAH7653677.1 hypothetical protein IHE45_19G095500 [Dioscorea alata]
MESESLSNRSSSENIIVRSPRGFLEIFHSWTTEKTGSGQMLHPCFNGVFPSSPTQLPTQALNHFGPFRSRQRALIRGN